MNEESDEFFDAIETKSSNSSDSRNSLFKKPFDVNHTNLEIKTDEIEDRKKFNELRQQIQSDDDDLLIILSSAPESQTSSIDDIPPSKSIHPFRVIEHNDTHSLKSSCSLNSQIERKLCSHNPITSSLTESVLLDDVLDQNIKIQHPEPDVIASTKNSLVTSPQSPQKTTAHFSSNVSTVLAKPIPPPRRKKKLKSMISNSSNPLNEPVKSLNKQFGDNKTESILVETKNKLSLKDNLVEIDKSGSLQQIEKKLDEKKVKKCDSNPESSKKSKIEELKKELLNANQNCNKLKVSSSQNHGRNSLGPHRSSKRSCIFQSCTERRRSAGDEDILKQLNLSMNKTKAESGSKLSDKEILRQVTVLNLDTGERLPLSEAEHKLPQCINPLSREIMRLTSEYVSDPNIEKHTLTDNESLSSKKSNVPSGSDDLSLFDSDTLSIRNKKWTTEKLRRLLDVTVKKAKSIAQARHKENVIEIADEANPQGSEEQVKLKVAHSHKGPYEFQNAKFVQALNDEHSGAVWCMKFSNCGRLLATAGQDRVLRVWVIYDAFQYFLDMRNKYNLEKVSPTPSQESLSSHQSLEGHSLIELAHCSNKRKTIFVPKPFCTYSGHSSDLLDVAWSKNYFILSSSMDKTVRLWHISRKECLCIFHHIDFVTAIAFHPKDDRYFLSGSLDGKLRLWNIPDKKVALWNEVDGQSKLITAANFCQNGKFAVVGTYDGRCIFYTTERLKYHTQIHVRSTRGRNSTGRKISGIEPMPGEDKILVTSNDSRIRLYELHDLSLSCKYKGAVNISSQIKACFSHDGKFIVSGSENRDIYIWKTHHDYSTFSSVRTDRNIYWEAIRAHQATVTCAIFAPNPNNILEMLQNHEDISMENIEDPLIEQHRKGCGGHVLVSADFNGYIKVFINRMKPKHSSLPVSALS